MGKAESSLEARFFRPRRLGHVNLFVSSYERASEFYQTVVGFEEVYRQPDNRASFVSNGNTYHDLGLTDVTSHYAPAGQKPGLNHIAFELETEADLVSGYRQSVEAGVEYYSIQDHDVAHSLYKFDPEGNAVEIYADVVTDWRAARHGVFEKVKPEWIPGVTNVPSTQRHYPQDPPIRVVPSSIFRARRVTHAAFVAKDFEKMFDYYTQVVGLSPYAGGRDQDGAVLAGTFGTVSLSLVRATPGAQPGLHHVGIEVKDESELDRALGLLPAAGIAVEQDVDHPARRAVTIQDPDGIRLQFYVNRQWTPETLSGVGAGQARYLL
ncbi:VOC family protein [Pigmentiphaga soli]|uniref:VOC family protein n=1 Tax=Pigmentiphaga soli TaxID=1007095 RepID=A0ABP8H662_9BURK